MKNGSIVILVLSLLFSGSLKAQNLTVKWERTGGIAATHLSFSPDSSEVLVSGPDNLEIRNVVTGNLIRKLPFASLIYASSWSPHGDTIAVTGTDSLFLLHAKTGKVLKTIPVAKNESFVYSPEGKYFVGNSTVLKTSDRTDISGSFKKNRYKVLYPFFVLPGDTTALQFRAEDSVVMVSMADGVLIRHYTAVKNATAFYNSSAPVHIQSGTLALSKGDTVLILRLSDGEILKRLVARIGRYLRPMSFTPDGEYIVCADKDRVDFIHIKTGDIIENSEYSTPERSRAIISRNGATFLNNYSPLEDCSDPKKNQSILKILDMKTGWITPNDRGHTVPVRGTEFVDNYRKLLTTDVDSVMLTWDMNTGQLLKQEKALAITYPALSLDSIVSTNGKYKIIVHKVYGVSLQLRDNQNDTFLRYLYGSYSFKDLSAVIFSPDGRYVLASVGRFAAPGTSSFVLQIWDVATGDIIATYDENCPAALLSVTPDNRSVVWITNSGKVKVFNVNGVMTDVEDMQSKFTFLKTTIHPNPLHETGTISYSVSAPGLLKISIHDIFGREIMVLKNEFSEPGKYTLPFKSSELSSGTYFLKVMSGEEVTTTQFSILR